MWPKLCRLCERPAADGAFRAVELDLGKFDEWCLKNLGTKLADKVEDDDLLCCYCIWDAKFLQENEGEYFWRPIKETSCGIEELYNYYKAGKVQQCWVSLKNVEVKVPVIEEKILSENEADEAPSDAAGIISGEKKSIYGKSKLFEGHHPELIKDVHANEAIKCNYHTQCRTYFKNVKDRDAHIKEIHLKPRVEKLFDCVYCPKFRLTRTQLYRHVKWSHFDIKIKCKVGKCGDFFKTQADLDLHVKNAHKKAEERRKFKCSICDYRTREKSSLDHHKAKKHQISVQPVECPECSKRLISAHSLVAHMNLRHKFRTCPCCDTQVPILIFSTHLTKVYCTKCSIPFDCTEQQRRHQTECKGPRLRCDMCPRTYHRKSLLQYHIGTSHLGNPVKRLQFKNRQFNCKICSRFFCRKSDLKIHIKRQQCNLRQVFACAHCSKEFINKTSLIAHLARKHFLINSDHHCQQCEKAFFSSSALKFHIENAHLKRTVECKICKKTLQGYILSTHMMRIHGVHGVKNL
ncbi:zinc finger protein 26-like [Neocloeon triangulifer]|uniref:zinc finger protein 26-like n=1 Tax=Neocloeon triangulifer TaxID=2078957 RepID=UPI00286F9982|nr:zinc finger protein 26-like [Neocloeon triangulifer]